MLRDRILNDIRHGTLYSSNQKQPPLERIVKWVGGGNSGSAYLMNDGKLLKLQMLRYPLFSKSTLTDQDLYTVDSEQKTVAINDVTIIELLSMSTLATSIVPDAYDFGYYIDEHSHHCSWITMSTIVGVTIGDYVNKMEYGDEDEETERLQYVRMVLGLVENLKTMYETYCFIHGDLTRSNMIVDLHVNAIKMIDFGRSQIMIDGITYYAHHVREKMEGKRLMKCGVDLCKVLQYYKDFSKDFEALLEKCVGYKGNSRPPVIYSYSEKLTYDSAINELRQEIYRLSHMSN